jgi:hypothetical protein
VCDGGYLITHKRKIEGWKQNFPRGFYEKVLTELSIDFNASESELMYDGSKRKEVAIETPPEFCKKGRIGTP